MADHLPLRTMAWAALLAGAFASLGCLPDSRIAGATEESGTVSGLRIARPRPAVTGEFAYEDSLPLVREPENNNLVAGPGGMVVLMQADRQHHPRLYLRDTEGGDSLRLLIDRYATKPRWAPVGERIACTVWKSRTLPWSLCLVTLGKPDTLYPLPDVNAVRYRWSPNARHVAVSATLQGGTGSVLYLVDARTGAHRALDTLQVYGEYDFGWSHDSRFVAVSRPIRLADTEEVLEAEIWIYDLAGHGVLAVPAEGHANVGPRWIDERRLLFTRQSISPGGVRETFAVELLRDKK